ncbi:MAG: hypothetical protein O8C63_10440 [Candidatus Methanoperedens sp.]|nr:hypothetical protein [Candidatus Methanoperedens sp.]
MASIWDKDLTKLELDNVRIHQGSLADAWKALSTEYLVRSVLVASDRALERMPFDYESARCTVKDLYDALSATYGLAWVQDELTGVVWFYPAETAYDHILTTRVHVAWDQPGLPMQSGILESLGTGSAAGINVKQWGSLFRNTFNYAVDVPAGTYTVQDLLNMCCAANPTKTFFAQVRNGEVFVTAVNLVSDEVRSVPAGALHLWDVEIRQGRGKGAPTQEQVMAALAHHDPEVRRLARNYLEAIIWSVPVDEWVNRRNSTVQTLWTCIGVTSVLVRSEEATHQAAIETMERLATDDFLAECEPGLALITALELARLTRNARALEVVRKRNLGANELAGVVSDACRIIALSGYVRQALKAKGADAIVGVLKPLAAVVRLPIAGKLEFKLATKYGVE